MRLRGCSCISCGLYELVIGMCRGETHQSCFGGLVWGGLFQQRYPHLPQAWHSCDPRTKYFIQPGSCGPVWHAHRVLCCCVLCRDILIEIYVQSGVRHTCMHVVVTAQPDNRYKPTDVWLNRLRFGVDMCWKYMNAESHGC